MVPLVKYIFLLHVQLKVCTSVFFNAVVGCICFSIVLAAGGSANSALKRSKALSGEQSRSKVFRVAPFQWGGEHILRNNWLCIPLELEAAGKGPNHTVCTFPISWSYLQRFTRFGHFESIHIVGVNGRWKVGSDCITKLQGRFFWACWVMNSSVAGLSQA